MLLGVLEKGGDYPDQLGRTQDTEGGTAQPSGRGSDGQIIAVAKAVTLDKVPQFLHPWRERWF